MKHLSIGLIFIFLLLTGCSMNLPKNKRELIQLNSNLVLNEIHLSKILDRLNKLETNPAADTVPLRILHLGDSHVQMGHFSNAIRSGMQEEFGGSELGMFFPYKLCGGYNPAGIDISTNSEWKCATNSKPDSTIAVGITGATAQTIDSISNITFAFKGRTKIKTVQIYHENLRNEYIISCEGAEIQTVLSSNYTELTTITLAEKASELEVKIVKTGDKPTHFSIYGVSMNQLKSKGIDYLSFGVSGNQYQFYAELNALQKAQVKDLNPELIIISLGSNDAYRKGIDSTEYQQQMNDFLTSLHQVVPNATFILTFPPDTKYNNERPDSENIVLNSIRATSEKMKIAAWDFHTLMGGFNSNPAWQKLDLANKDGLHLTDEGYQIEGALFNLALAKALKSKYPASTWLEKAEATYQNQISKVKIF